VSTGLRYTGAGRDPAAALERWLAPGARALERHEILVERDPAAALDAVLGITLAELPISRTLFRLRGLRSSPPGTTLARFFSTPPFLLLERTPREAVFGLALRPRSPATRRLAATGPGAFRAATGEGLVRITFDFRASPRPPGTLLSTETWIETRGAGTGALFRLYWLVVGPFSALTRREFLRVARDRVQAPRAP
jgi:hypothetical protein